MLHLLKMNATKRSLEALLVNSSFVDVNLPTTSAKTNAYLSNRQAKEMKRLLLANSSLRSFSLVCAHYFSVNQD